MGVDHVFRFTHVVLQVKEFAADLRLVVIYRQATSTTLASI